MVTFFPHNKISKLHLLTVAATTMFFLFLSGCGQSSPNSDETSYSCTDYAMGTVINQTLYINKSASESTTTPVKTKKEAHTYLVDTSKDVMSKLNNLEKKYLSWRCEGSVIDKINATAGTDKSVILEDKLNNYIQNAIQLANLSNGAFDPTIGKLTRLWDIGGDNPHIPADEDIKEELGAAGWQKLIYQADSHSLALGTNTSLDLGAIGKGIGCDEIDELLKNEHPEIGGAMIAVGGSILVYGNKGSDAPWNIAITGPRQEISNEYLGKLKLAANNTTFVSTSGDYEKYFKQDGVRYHHILDPSTGYPSDSGLISVTIVCNNGLISDGLSTACFVLGLDLSLPLLKKYNAEAVFVDSNRKVTVTDGLKKYFELTSKGYTY